MTGGEPSLLLTPDAAGLLSEPPAPALLPAAAFFESELPRATRLLPPEALEPRPDDVSRALSLTDRLRRTLLAEVSPEDASAEPLVLDFAVQTAEMLLERARRLAAARQAAPRAVLHPARLRFRFPVVHSGRLLKRLHKPQAYQWLLLRQLAGAPDEIVWEGPGPLRRAERRARQELWLRREQRRLLAQAGPGRLYGAHLGRARPLLERLGVAPLPDLVRTVALRRDERRRDRLAQALADALLQELPEAPERAGVERAARFAAAAFPESRLELLDANRAAHARFFDRASPRGFVTSRGQGRYDPNLLFAAECRRRGRPVVVVQHGGQYGYDDKIPSFTSSDAWLADVFVTWGWSELPRLHAQRAARARLLALPEPGLSELLARPWRPPEGPPTLLVPLSKLRTLDNRVGGNATDASVPRLRRETAAAVTAAAGTFERVLVTHRSAAAANDPLLRELATLGGRVELLDSAAHPAGRLLERSHAVLWDVTATGMWESLTAGVPTVVLAGRGRFAPEAGWAEQKLRDAGVCVESGLAAASSLQRFVTDAAAWPAARAAVEPVLRHYALASADAPERWRAFLESL